MNRSDHVPFAAITWGTVSMSDKLNEVGTVDLNAPLHTEQLADGWYAIGMGMLIPCRDRDEAEAIVGRHEDEWEWREGAALIRKTASQAFSHQLAYPYHLIRPQTRENPRLIRFR